MTDNGGNARFPAGLPPQAYFTILPFFARGRACGFGKILLLAKTGRKLYNETRRKEAEEEMQRIIADYHTHTTISPDGVNSMEELCAAALARGLSEIAFTDHFEIYTPGFPGSKYSPLGQFTLAYLEEYRRRFERCREAWDGRIVLKSGVELGQPQEDPDFAGRALAVMPFDFVLGSQHKVDNIDFSQRDYRRGGERNEELLRMDLDALAKLADTGDFDCVAHIDLIKRYAARQGERVTLMDHPEELRAILRRLIERGKGIEINTSGFRQGMGEPVPALELLKLYRSLGGEILTFGSDAHRAEDVAADFEAARQAALAAGFRAAARYTRRKPEFYDIG